MRSRVRAGMLAGPFKAFRRTNCPAMRLTSSANSRDRKSVVYFGSIVVADPFQRDAQPRARRDARGSLQGVQAHQLPGHAVDLLRELARSEERRVFRIYSRR